MCTSAFAHSDSAVGGRGTAVDKLPRGECTGRGGVGLVHFRLCARRFAHQRARARR